LTLQPPLSSKPEKASARGNYGSDRTRITARQAKRRRKAYELALT
jgi:hypothetical protein